MSNNAIGLPRTLLVLAICAAPALGAGKSVVVSGTENPPPHFGSLVGNKKECSILAGGFRWESAERKQHDRRFRGLPGASSGGVFGPEMQLWITRGAGDSLVLRTRDINRDSRLRTTSARDWSMVTYTAKQFKCAGGMLVLTPMPVLSAEDISNWGGKGLLRGLKLGLLEDGSLAWGVQNVSTGHHGSLFTWSDTSAGSYKAADKAYWSWTKLARIGEGTGEPAPMDAGRR